MDVMSDTKKMRSGSSKAIEDPCRILWSRAVTKSEKSTDAFYGKKSAAARKGRMEHAEKGARPPKNQQPVDKRLWGRAGEKR